MIERVKQLKGPRSHFIGIGGLFFMTLLSLAPLIFAAPSSLACLPCLPAGRVDRRA
jgi:hypothetical protein